MAGGRVDARNQRRATFRGEGAREPRYKIIPGTIRLSIKHSRISRLLCVARNVEAVRRVGLLLRLNNHHARAQRVYRATCNVDHLALVTLIQFSTRGAADQFKTKFFAQLGECAFCESTI